MKKKYLVSTCISIVLLVFIVLPPVAQAQEPLIFGLPSFVSATDLYKRFSPLADRLSKDLGRPVKFLTEVDYEAHLMNLKNGDLDIAFLGPASYVSYTKRFGKVPILAVFETNGSKTFKGFIVVRKDSPITELSQLKGKKIAFGDVKSTMGHIVPRYMLLKAGIDLKQLANHQFLDNQENVALGVLSGNFDAGALREDMYNHYTQEGLRAVAISEPMPDHLFVARAGLPDDTVRKISKILFSLKDTEEGRQVLRSVQKSLTALVPGTDANYDPLRKVSDALAKVGINP